MKEFKEILKIEEGKIDASDLNIRTLIAWVDDIIFSSSDAHNALLALKRKKVEVDTLIKDLLKINKSGTKLNSQLKSVKQ